jgi:hypothetical protein
MGGEEDHRGARSDEQRGGEGRGTPNLGEVRRRRRGQWRINAGDDGEMRETKRPRSAA